MKGALEAPHSGFFRLLQRPVSDWYGELGSHGVACTGETGKIRGHGDGTTNLCQQLHTSRRKSTVPG
jgi:hypothetical protein